MEMRKTVLYGVLAFCLVVLNSCLGDPATQLTMANQAGVVVTGYGPGKAIYTKGDVVVSSEDFQNANVENGECILFDYSIDYGVANNMGRGRIPVIPRLLFMKIRSRRSIVGTSIIH